ncbi:MAG: sulfatase [Bacteroidia bacterium]
MMRRYLYLLLFLPLACQSVSDLPSRPNILLFITDDQSFAHISLAGCAELSTPNFDRVASEGIWFRQAFAASPGCSPSRAALLTGRNCWQLEAAGTHASHFPKHYQTYPDILAEEGYHTGFTGKGWGPGNWEKSERPHNPAGPAFNKLKLESPEGISDKDYAGNFARFLSEREEGQPFCFWAGTHEPHRQFQWQANDRKKISKVGVPGFLPDTDSVRQDLLDYYNEIEWADQQLGYMIRLLEDLEELDNTLIIVTSDNGMAFPRAKANVYEYGFHVPMAMRWGEGIAGGNISDALVSFIDIAPTLVELAGGRSPKEYPMSGRSLMPILLQEETLHSRKQVFATRERHSSSRYLNRGYPQRAMRTEDFLLIWNPQAQRWPAGAPQKYGVGNYPSEAQVETKLLGPMHWGGYHDIDACPTLDYMIAHREDEAIAPLFQAAVGKRPEWELFDLKEDPASLFDISARPAYHWTLDSLQQSMMLYLKETGDPRALGNGEVFESYPRYSRIRSFPPTDSD